jgi:hypothetical protein
VIRHRSSRSLRSGDANQLAQSVQPAIFGTENSSVVTASSGSTTILPCTVKKFGNGVVSREIIVDATLPAAHATCDEMRAPLAFRLFTFLGAINSSFISNSSLL